VDGPHAGEPTTGRGEIERLARVCRAAACQAGLDSTVTETRFNVVRSGVPDVVTTARRLRDYLPPEDGRDLPTRAEVRCGETATTRAVGFRGGHGPSPGSSSRRACSDVA
jgi:hypothetical protein